MLSFRLNLPPGGFAAPIFAFFPQGPANSLWINMEKLNEYLKTLLSTCGEELHLEPDKKPYVVTADGSRDVANVPILGTQISMMVFPLIPPETKSELPHRSEVEFVHPHNLGNFNFVVQKSPAGFNVTIRPLISEYGNASRPAANELPPDPPSPAAPPEPVPAIDTINYDSASAWRDESVPILVPTASAPGLTIDVPPEVLEYSGVAGQPEIEVVSVNAPEYTTVFSPTAEYEPPGNRNEFASEYIPPSAPPSFESPQPVHTFEPQPEVQSFQQPQTSVTSFEPPPPAMHDFPSPTPPVQSYQPTPVSTFTPSAANPQMTAKMDALFMKMAEIGASDLHLSVSMPPLVRKDGKMAQLQPGDTQLTPESIRPLLLSIMPERNQKEFAERSDTDFAYEIPGLARFRCNVFADRKGMGAVFRIIPSKILTAEQLGLSKAIMDLCSLSKGLVVVTGPTGSGKSTTLCAMVDSINKNREDHIITIEDPIEFVHDNQKCLVNQREVHNHTDSFKDALRAALREDPDIVLVGEMRDLETISIAIETAETGHLVFGTLHTTTAASTVDRIIDQFPADRQQQIRVMLSESLKGVIAQTLLPKKGGGRVAALEVLIVTPAISNLIREGKTFQIPSSMQTGRNHGMVMLNDALFEHVQNGTVEPLDAYIKAIDKAGFETLLTRGGFKI